MNVLKVKLTSLRVEAAESSATCLDTTMVCRETGLVFNITSRMINCLFRSPTRICIIRETVEAEVSDSFVFKMESICIYCMNYNVPQVIYDSVVSTRAINTSDCLASYSTSKF